MVRKRIRYCCEVCSYTHYDKDYTIEHEKIPITGEEFDNLILRRTDFFPSLKYVALQTRRLNRRHIWEYRVHELTHPLDSDEWEHQYDYWAITKANKIKEEIQEGKLVELTDEEFAKVAPLVREHFKIKPRRT